MTRNDLIYYPLVFDKFDHQNWISNWSKNYQRLVECDKKAQERGSLVGRFFSVPCADGYAYYQITRDYKHTVHLQLVTGVGDDWEDHHFMDGGSFPKKDVLRYIEWEDRRKNIPPIPPLKKANETT